MPSGTADAAMAARASATLGASSGMPSPTRVFVALACFSALLQPLAAQSDRDRRPSMQRLLARQFQRQLDSLAAAGPGVVGVTIEDLSSGERFAVNDSLVFPQASAIKVAILLELMRQADSGLVALGDRVEVTAGQRVGGDGVLHSFADRGSALSLHDLAILMVTLSDNTATNVLIERVGMANVNRTLAGMGLGEIRLRRPMIASGAVRGGNLENLADPVSGNRAPEPA